MPIAFRLKIRSCEARICCRQPIVTCTLPDGRRFQLMHAFPNIKAARAVALKVHAKGSIDQSLWAPLVPVAGSPADKAIEAAAKDEAELDAQYRNRIAA
jgi:hypothetical protein